MTIDLYWISGSPYAWRVFLALELKGLAYNSKLLSMDQGDLKKPDFLRISPRGLVPAIVDGDVNIAESLAILAYIEAKFPAKPITGQSAPEKARIMQEISETTYLEAPTRQVAGAIFFNRVDGKENEVNEAAEKLRAELGKLEQKLKSGKWLAGTEEISAADIWAFPFVMVVQRAAEKPAAQKLKLDILPFAKNYPAITAWIEKIKALPFFERTYPPNWRKQEKAA